MNLTTEQKIIIVMGLRARIEELQNRINNYAKGITEATTDDAIKLCNDGIEYCQNEIEKANTIIELMKGH